jgi:lycopene cyclase domain-containing protein
MTYFQVLLTFIVPPLLVLLVLAPGADWRRLVQGRPIDWKPYLVILAHVGMALVYTTPWDNYLVATGVWWYNPALVTGITFGYVPVEEYTFFVVQTLLTGFWCLYLMRTRLPQVQEVRSRRRFRLASAALVALFCLGATLLLFTGWPPVTYLALIVSWALAPVFIQVVFGGDILLANWKLLAAAILTPTFYLWWVDSLAITAGTWTIDPAQTTGVMLGALPLEEMLFFFITNVIIGFGVTLMLSPAAQGRALEWQARWRAWRGRGSLPKPAAPSRLQTSQEQDS